MTKSIFVNLPVKDLKKSMAFFAALGWPHNPQFTDDTAACIVISDTIYAMVHDARQVHRIHRQARLRRAQGRAGADRAQRRHAWRR